MNVLTGILLVLFIILVVRGFRKGILIMLLGIVTSVLMLLISFWLCPRLEIQLESSPLRTRVEATVDARITAQEEKYGPDRVSLPVFMKKGLDSGLEKLGIHEALVETCTTHVLKAIALVLTLLISGICLFLIRHFVLLLNKVPVIGGGSRVVGGLFGALEGVLLVWLILFLIQCLFSGSRLAGGVDESPVLSYVNSYNLFARIF